MTYNKSNVTPGIYEVYFNYSEPFQPLASRFGPKTERVKLLGRIYKGKHGELWITEYPEEINPQNTCLVSSMQDDCVFEKINLETAI